MINSQKQKEVLQYLIDRKIPADLALEIRDHMLSQLETELDKDLDFYFAFDQVKRSWKYDLHHVYPVLSWKTVARIHLHSVRKISNDLAKKSICYFLPIFIVLLFLTYFNPHLTKNMYWGLFLTIVGVSSYLYLRNFKLINSAGTHFKTNISIYQRGVSLFPVSAMYVLIFNLFNYSGRFEKYSLSWSNIIDKNEFTVKNLSYIVLENTFIWTWILGILFLKQYKNAFEQVNKQLKIKL